MEKIVTPDFGESVFEASVGKWFKSAGETVNAGETIVELHTDKAVQEINAIRCGVIGTILKKVDEIVRPGEALCEFQPTDAGSEEDAKEVQVISIDHETEGISVTETEDNGTLVSMEEIEMSEEVDDYVEIQFSPFTEMQQAKSSDSVSEPEYVDEADPAIALEDIESEKPPIAEDSNDEHANNVMSSTSDATAAYPSQSLVECQIAELRRMQDNKPTRREHLSRRRLTAARRMSEVQAEAVMTTTYNEVDMHEVIRIRRDFGDQFLERNGVKLGFMSFFVKAVSNSLKMVPIMNSELEGKELIYKEYYDIGIAVASDHGLVVPVIRDADKKSFALIEREIRDFAEKARTGSFDIAELIGGTFTITNGGVFGSMMSTPILNLPQVGILGMHNIVDRAVVVEDQITIRPMMYLAVTYDHRIVEGAQAVQFLTRIKQSMESAELLMLSN